MKKNSASNCLKRINTKKTYVAFFPWCKKKMPANFFSFQGFSERISCDPNPDSWSLNKRNEIVWIAHLLLYKIMIYSFLSFPFWPGSRSAFYFSDLDRAKTCGFGSETLACTWGFQFLERVCLYNYSCRCKLIGQLQVLVVWAHTCFPALSSFCFRITGDIGLFYENQKLYQVVYGIIFSQNFSDDIYEEILWQIYKQFLSWNILSLI